MVLPSTLRRFGLVVALAAATCALGVEASEPASVDEIEALEAEVRERLRDARIERDRDAKRAAYAALVPSAERLLALRPDADSRYALIQAHFGTRDFVAGRAVAERWRADEPTAWTPHLLVGQALTWERDYEAAVEPLEQALALAPDEPSRVTATKSLGFALEKLQRFEHALEHYDRLDDPSHSDRVRANLETLEIALGPITDGCVYRQDMQDANLALEAALEALDDPDGR